MFLEEQYDAQIRTHREQVRRTSERRNADCSATKRLPSEILSLIFRQLSCTNDTRHQPRCISVTRVCHLWRTIALNEPRLWTDLQEIRGEWLLECVKRSKAAPLKIRYVAYNPRSEDGDIAALYVGPHFALPNSARTPFRDWTETPAKARNVLEPLFESPWKLGELHIVGCADDLITRLAAPTPYLSALTVARVDVPDNFLGGAAPRLQSVHLRMTRVSLRASWLKNVQRLTLCRWQPSGDNNTRTILSALANLTHLKFLSMSFPETLTALGSDSDSVTLPSLKTAQFSFSSNQLRLVGIFDYITCPIIEELSINWPPNFGDVALAKRVGQFFSKNCHFTPEILERNGTWSFSEMRLFGRGRDGIPKLYFRNCLPNALEDFLSQAFPGIHPRCLRIFVGALILKNYPIEELFISDPSYRMLLDEGPVYPSLRRITLVNIGLTPKAQTLSGLKRWLKAQERLEKLTIMGSGAFTAKDIQALERIVGVVEVVPVSI